MGITISNTLSGKKETFEPLEPKRVRMYACGPTVYGFTHIGNARPTVFFDVVRRFLEYRGYKVTFVSNFTDVDDRIINRAREEKTSSDTISRRFIDAFLVDCRRLNVRPPDVAPKVTEHIPEIIFLIERLIRNGVAYVTSDGEVLYSVRKFSDYGKLSKKRLDDLRTAVRIDPSEKKQDPLDFSLWKPQKSSDEPSWDSPWGKGRPGWHIECSAMAMRHLGETFDIHGGGLDLIHPHHENEIAQSEGATHKPFAKYWLHNNLVTIEDTKMSKSIGNIFLNRDFMDCHSPETLRFLLLSGHYRSPIDFSQKHIQESQAALHRYYSCVRRINESLECKAYSEHSNAITAFESFTDRFETLWVAAMEDDFNTAKVIGIVFEFVRRANSALDAEKNKTSNALRELARKFISEMKKLGAVLNLFNENASMFLRMLRLQVAAERGLDVSEIDVAVLHRSEARRQKDYQTADRIRQELLAKGIEIRDLPQGTEWDVIFK